MLRSTLLGTQHYITAKRREVEVARIFGHYGVIYYQSRPYSKNRKRIIIGHGPESIYKSLVEAIS